MNLNSSLDKSSNHKQKTNALISKFYNSNERLKIGGVSFSILSLAACTGGGGGGGGGNAPAPTNNTSTPAPTPPPAPTTSTFVLLSPNNYIASSNLPGTFNQPTSTADLSVTGRGGNDNITTGSGDDTLIGGAGNDTLNSGAGLDLIEGGSGADNMNGGAGLDWLSYQNSTSAVNVNLATGVASGGHAQGDTITNFELVIGSSYNDTIIGDSNVNFLEGAAGADNLIAGGPQDFITFYTSPSAVNVNLGTGVHSGGHATGDTYTNIYGVFGSAFNDNLTGDDQNNELWGAAGDDTLNGGDGNDILDGDVGNDNINGGSGHDLILGGAGSDTMDGGDGIDLLDYSLSQSGVTVNLLTGIGSNGDAAGDTFTNIEDVYGSDFADTITGDGEDNLIDGFKGVDTINGGAGDDHFLVYQIDSSEEDTIDGGDGHDRLELIGSSTVTSYSVMLASVDVTNIETIRMGNGFKESLTLTAQDVIDVTDADNVLEIIGHVTDVLSTGSAWVYNQDEMRDGEIYHNYTSGAATLYVHIETGTQTGFPVPVASFSETVSGVYDANDNNDSSLSLTELTTDVIVNGKDGNDLIVTGAGDDTLNGGNGDDMLRGTNGSDTLNGGAGNDILFYDSDNIYDGGADSDTLLVRFEDFDLDLSTVSMTNMEIVDVTEPGANTVMLTSQDVLDVSDAGNQLIIMGDAEDSVTSTGQGWVQGIDQVIDTQTYNTYTSGAATLLVDEDITQTIS